MVYFIIFHFVFSLGHCKNILFKDYSAEHSLNFIHDHGGSGEYYYVESMGSGICLIDYDNDGDLDAYFPQGAPLPGWEKDKINDIELGDKSEDKEKKMLCPQGDCGRQNDDQ